MNRNKANNVILIELTNITTLKLKIKQWFIINKPFTEKLKLNKDKQEN